MKTTTTILLFLVLSIGLIGCKKDKDNNPNLKQGNMTVTYAGNTYTFDSVYYDIQSQNANLTITQLRIFGIDENSSVSTGDYLQFDCVPTLGAQDYTTYWSFNIGMLFRLDSVLISDNSTVYNVNVTSNTDNVFSGTFSSVLNSQPLSGTFTGVKVK